MSYRVESDLLGELKIKDDLYYGAQTERALRLCNPTNEKLNIYPELVNAIAQIKKAASVAHFKLGVMNKELSDSISLACDEIIAGKHSDQFVVDIFNGGGGVSIHMNVNEVIANRANEIVCGKIGSSHVHPNTHVNMGQSTNDVLPSAMKIALYKHLDKVVSSLSILTEETGKKAVEFKNVVKVSRTCLQDAVPMTLGQSFSSYHAFLSRQLKGLRALMDDILHIPLGATVVGTGLGAYLGYRDLAIDELRSQTGLDIRSDENLFDGLQNADIYIKASSALKALATGISKMSKDIRLLSSGPRAGLNEINIDPTQNGSSIMPGKVNPALPELMIMASYQVCGNDLSITMAAEGGELDLNVWEPIIIVNLLGSCQLLTECIPVFATRCISNISANHDVCLKNANESLALAVVVAAIHGYGVASGIAKSAATENTTIKEEVIGSGLMTKEEADQLLDPLMLSDEMKSGELLLRLKRSQINE